MNDQDIHDYLYWCADRYLSYRPRTEYELRRYLKRKLYSRDIVDPDKQEEYIGVIMKKLNEEDRLNDEKFLKMFIDDRQYFKPRGKRRLVLELKQKGVADPLIEDYFSTHTIDEVPIIISIIQKKLFFDNPTNSQSENPEIDQELRKKITNHLLRRGFTYDHIKLAFEDFIKKK
jgi:regulatory protein